MDSFGITGMALSYAVIFCLSGSAFLLFFYLWYKGRLDMDEEPKHEMMGGDDDTRE